MIDQLKQQYSDFKIKNHNTGWVEVITPFLDTSYDFISVYIKENKISDVGNTMQCLANNTKAKVIDYINKETTFWNDRLSIENNEIVVTWFEPSQIMPFIQLLIKIQGIIENE